MSIEQNVWQLKGIWLNRQKRRSEVVRRSIPFRSKVLDIGCAEGFTTKYIAGKAELVVGIEINFDNLKIAKKKVKEAMIINGSIDFLPFREEWFDAITILEVLEHLPVNIQKSGLSESNRVLKSGGVLILSVPYKEKIIINKCIHCLRDTPLWGHLHSFDEDKIKSILPRGKFTLIKRFILPHMVYLSCLSLFMSLPIGIWLEFNNLLGKLKFLRGYWLILDFRKS